MKRRELYVRAQQLFARDLPYLIVLVKDNVAVLPRELAGYAHYPSGAFTALRELHWER